MVLMDILTRPGLGYLYYPNWTIGVILLLLAPLASILSIELSVIMSARAGDVRTVQQLSGVFFFPFLIIYVMTEIGVIALSTTNLLIMSGIFLAIDIFLFYLSTATFKREEILTKWK
jgi:ABC-2 type transport system permease protein